MPIKLLHFFLFHNLEANHLSDNLLRALPTLRVIFFLLDLPNHLERKEGWGVRISFTDFSTMNSSESLQMAVVEGLSAYAQAVDPSLVELLQLGTGCAFQAPRISFHGDFSLALETKAVGDFLDQRRQCGG